MTGKPADEQRQFEQLIENNFSVSHLKHPQIRGRLLYGVSFLGLGLLTMSIIGESSSTLETTLGMTLLVISTLGLLKMVDELACFVIGSHSCNQCRRKNSKWGRDE